MTKHFLEDFQRKREPESEDSKKKLKESVSHDIDIIPTQQVLEKTPHKPTKATPQKIKKKTTVTEQNKVERTKTKMGKSSSTEIRLRGKYMQATVKQREHTKLLQNKLPLTNAKKTEYGLPSNTTLKFHYESADLLLEDHKQYIMKFQDHKAKPVEQNIVDIKDVWMSVDKTMCLFPNGLREHEMVESCFYLPQKRKLIDN